MRGEGRVITPDWVATDWCESVYLPAVVAIRQDGLAGQCPEATEADRVLCLPQRRRELSWNWAPLAFNRSASRRCSTVRCGRIPQPPQVIENFLDSPRRCTDRLDQPRSGFGRR